MNMSNEQLCQALFECYTGMITSTSNEDRGIGNGKNISVAKLPYGKYIIRNGRKDIISYKMPNDDTLYNMGAKHLILNEIPSSFYVHELVTSDDLKPGYDITPSDISVNHKINKISNDLIFNVKQDVIDRFFITDSYQNDEMNGYLYKVEIEEKLAKYVVYNETARSVIFEFYDTTIGTDPIQAYKIPNSFCSSDNPSVIFTNNIYRLNKSALSYIDRYIDKQSINRRSILQSNVKSLVNDKINLMTNEQIDNLVKYVNNLV